MGRKEREHEPTLAEAWEHLGAQWGLQVTAARDDSIEAHGTIRGRGVSVMVERTKAVSEGWRFLFGVNTISSRNRRDTWRTVLAVRCVNPSGLTGRISSFVDVNDPAWTPGQYDPRAGRHVRSDPADLLGRVLDANTHESLMSIMDDITVHITADTVVIDEQGTSVPDGGARYVAGSFIHHYQGSPPPMPARAVAGPPWWIDLLCDIADTIDR
jgi:hypothetical protein